MINIINWLLRPHWSVKDYETYEKIKFVNFMNLCAIGAIFLLNVPRLILLIINPSLPFDYDVFLTSVPFSFVLVNLVMGKTRYYKVGIASTFLLLLIANWTDYSQYMKDPTADLYLLNMTMIMGLLLTFSGLVLRQRNFLILSALILLNIILFHSVALAQPIEWVLPKIIFIVILFVGTLAGLRSRNSVMKALKNEREKAVEASKTKSLFIASVSHELRTPLNIIMGLSELLQDSSLLPDQREAYTEKIVKSSQSLAMMIEDILDLSKIDRGAKGVVEEPLDIRSVIYEITEVFEEQAEVKQLHFEKVVDQSIPSNLAGDKTLVRQILYNLVDNAIKFTERGTVRFEVQLVKEDISGCQVSFLVSDTGVGISEPDQKVIFEAFKQGANVISLAGTVGVGLGLSIVSQLVQLLQGSITFHSNEGVGSTFVMTLPFYREVTPSTIAGISDEVAPDEDRTKELPSSGQPKNLLLVDDYEDNLLILRAYLKEYPFNLFVASSGEEALSIYHSADLDLILMDLRMPGMSGDEVLQVIRREEEQERKRKIPIIAFTAYSMEYAKEQCLKLGFTDYFTKPVSKNHLQGIIKHYL